LPDYALTLEDDQAVFWRRKGNNAQKACCGELISVVAQSPIVASERRIAVSSEAMEQVPGMAPGWDKHWLEHAYNSLGKGQGRCNECGCALPKLGR